LVRHALPEPVSKRLLEHWISFAAGFTLPPQEFYGAVEKELAARKIPTMEMSRVEYAEGGLLSDKRMYLRTIRERLAFDMCAAPFGSSYFFSCRTVYSPPVLRLWHLFVALIVFNIVCSLLVQLLGPAFAGVAILALIVAIVETFRNGVLLELSDLDNALIKIPAIGLIYERWFRKAVAAPEATPVIPEPEEEPEPQSLVRDKLIELQTSLPADLDIGKDAFEQFLRNLALCREPVAFELLGSAGRVNVQFVAGQHDAPQVRRQLQAYFPDATFQTKEGALEQAWKTCQGGEMLVCEFALAREFMLPLASGKLDPFIGMVGALAELSPGDLGLFQILFQPAQEPWAENILRSVTHADGKPFFINLPELASAAENKVNHPLYAAVMRIATKGKTHGRALQIACDMASSLRVFAQPQENELIPLENDEDYPFDEHIEDVLRRQSRRSGMLLNSEELIGFVHLPSSAVRSPALARDAGKTKAAPAIIRNATGLLLGSNVHNGESIPVRLTAEQRVRHTHISSGPEAPANPPCFSISSVRTLRIARVWACLILPGDLIDRILDIIPDSRMDDVILVNPYDTDFPIGFNILQAHSEDEKNVLASDLVSMFRRLSTSWG
jgi:hypothetical protein